MQKTSFKIELVIGEDCSTDSTRKICEDYANNHSEIIRLLPSKQNHGMNQNGIRTLQACRGKYIATCEGDDYWIDPYKLQKQVEFMEKHEAFSLCFHNANFIDMTDGSTKLFRKSSKKVYYTKDVILSKWFCPSASILLRRSAINNYPVIDKHIINGDLVLLFIVSLQGPLYYIDEVMSVYRCGVPGSMSANHKSKKSMLGYKNILNYLTYINKISHNKFIIYILMKKIYVFLAMIKSVMTK